MNATTFPSEREVRADAQAAFREGHSAAAKRVCRIVR